MYDTVHKKEMNTDICNNLDESPENYAKVKKLTPESSILYHSIYLAFLKWQNTEMERLVVARG